MSWSLNDRLLIANVITWLMPPSKTFWTISRYFPYVEPIPFTVFALFNEEIRFLSLMDEIFLKRIESSTWVLLMKGRTFWTVIELTWEESIFNKLIEAKFILTTFYGDIITINCNNALAICQSTILPVYPYQSGKNETVKFLISLSWRCKTAYELLIPDFVSSNNNCRIIQSRCTKNSLNIPFFQVQINFSSTLP